MTAHDLDPNARTALGLNEPSLLTKPFSMAELLRAIDAARQGGATPLTS
jgi:DNA-binding response OmpR family regulator